MEQEAADELLAREREHLVAIAVAVVLVGEPHPALVHGEQARIGEGDAVTVATQIRHHRLGVGETGLGVDHSVVGLQRIEHRLDLARLAHALEPARLELAAQAADEAAPEAARQRPHRSRGTCTRGEDAPWHGAPLHRGYEVAWIGLRVSSALAVHPGAATKQLPGCTSMPDKAQLKYSGSRET